MKECWIVLVKNAAHTCSAQTNKQGRDDRIFQRLRCIVSFLSCRAVCTDRAGSGERQWWVGIWWCACIIDRGAMGRRWCSHIGHHRTAMWLSATFLHCAFPNHIGHSTAVVLSHLSTQYTSNCQDTTICQPIQLLEYPIPPPRPSQKPRVQWISGTERAIIDPRVSKRPEQVLSMNKKISTNH